MLDPRDWEIIVKLMRAVAAALIILFAFRLGVSLSRVLYLGAVE